jgi:RNA polymerase sigma factor (sigma-70 family)
MNKDKLEPMNPDDYYGLCSKMAYKYKSPHLYDDLVSEGLLAIYEWVDKTACHLNKPKAIQVANEAMWVYLNIKSLSVSVPASKTSMNILRGNYKDIQKNSDYSKDGLKWLSMVLSGATENIMDETLVDTVDEELQMLESVWEVILNKLDAKGVRVMTMLYQQGMNYKQVGDEFGVSGRAVSYWEEDYIDIIKKELL